MLSEERSNNNVLEIGLGHKDTKTIFERHKERAKNLAECRCNTESNLFDDWGKELWFNKTNLINAKYENKGKNPIKVSL